MLQKVSSFASDNKYKIAVVALAVLIIVFFSIYDGTFHIIKKDFTNPHFLFFFIAMVLFSIWTLNSGNEKYVTATQYAIVGFVIAYLAHLDMIFTAYIVVWLLHYFML